MSERHIIIPPPAEFRDSVTREIILARNEDNELVPHPERSFDWFMHVHVLTHLQFSVEIGGYEAVKAGKNIAKAMENALDAGKPYFVVTADEHRRLMRCIATPTDNEVDETLKEKPNMRIIAKSALGMRAAMNSITAYAFCEFMDAIANASTNKPTALLTPVEAEAVAEAEATN